MWVRFSGLPIKYYDKKFLSAIGNRIGRTVRVDKNTSKQERGKYARMSVEVDLTQPLLAMFEVHDHMYPVEYEGLHFLCLTCGRFGHYKEGCPHKSSPTGANGKKDEVGPWLVVQKLRRSRRGTGSGDGQGEKVRTTAGTGSRFSILENEGGHDMGAGAPHDAGKTLAMVVVH